MLLLLANSRYSARLLSECGSSATTQAQCWHDVRSTITYVVRFLLRITLMTYLHVRMYLRWVLFVEAL